MNLYSALQVDNRHPKTKVKYLPLKGVVFDNLVAQKVVYLDFPMLIFGAVKFFAVSNRVLDSKLLCSCLDIILGMVLAS